MTSRYRWTILAAGTTAQASFSAALIGLPALAPALRTQYDLTLGETGVVLGAMSLGLLLTLYAWGLLADRLGERAVIVLGLATGGVVLALAGETTSFGALVATLALAGALGASVNSASGRAVMGWFEEDERGLALGIRQAAVPIGGAIAALDAAAARLRRRDEARVRGARRRCRRRRRSRGRACCARLRTGRRPRRAARAPSSATACCGCSRAARRSISPRRSRSRASSSCSSTATAGSRLTRPRACSRSSTSSQSARVSRAGRWSDRTRTRIAPLRAVGLALATATVVAAALVDAPLAVLIPALIVDGVLGFSWNGLSFTAAAERAGAARSGAALGFQQTTLAVVGAIVPPAFAALVDGDVVAGRVRGRRRRPGGRRAPAAARAGSYAPRSRANTRNVGDPAGSSLNSGLTQPSSPERCA